MACNAFFQIFFYAYFNSLQLDGYVLFTNGIVPLALKTILQYISISVKEPPKDLLISFDLWVATFLISQAAIFCNLPT